MLKIGLTGGVATGKSVVATILSELGVEIIDADIISRELTRIGSPAYYKIIDLFGSSCLIGNELDRLYLRTRVFSDYKLMKSLEEILHPLVYHEIILQLELRVFSYCVIAVPLLFERGFDSLVDRTLVVDCPLEAQKNRFLRRDPKSSHLINMILNTQFSRELKIQLADDVIDNSGSVSYLRYQVEHIHHRYSMLAKG